MTKTTTLALLLLGLTFGLSASRSNNILFNSNFALPIEKSNDYEPLSMGAWRFFACADNGSKATLSLVANGYVDNCLQVEMSDVPSGDPWSGILYQDFANLRATRYELVFWVKADVQDTHAINVSALNKENNKLLVTKSESGFRYSDVEWLPCVTYLDFSNCTSQELSHVRLALHFSHSGTYYIDEMSFRPVYDVLLEKNGVTDHMIDNFSFDLPPFGCFEGWGQRHYNTPFSLVEVSQLGGSTQYIMMRYTNYPELGASPIEGEHSLFTEVTKVGGTPDYQIKLETPSIASEADGELIRFSFWAKSDASTASNPLSQQQFSLIPRFATTNKTTVQLSGSWKRYEYEYDLKSISYPDYRYIRLQLDKVNNYHIDGMLLEYVNIPDRPGSLPKKHVEGELVFAAEYGGVRVDNKEGIALSVSTADGQLCQSVESNSASAFIALPAGVYIIFWQTRENNNIHYEKIIVNP